MLVERHALPLAVSSGHAHDRPMTSKRAGAAGISCQPGVNGSQLFAINLSGESLGGEHDLCTERLALDASPDRQC